MSEIIFKRPLLCHQSLCKYRSKCIRHTYRCSKGFTPNLDFSYTEGTIEFKCNDYKEMVNYAFNIRSGVWEYNCKCGYTDTLASESPMPWCPECQNEFEQV